MTIKKNVVYILQTSPVDPPQISVTDAESAEQSTEPDWLKAIQTDRSIDECKSSLQTSPSKLLIDLYRLITCKIFNTSMQK